MPAGPKWDDAAVVATWGAAPDRRNGVTALASWCAPPLHQQPPGAPSVVAVGRAAGRVQLLDGANGTQLAAWQVEPGSSGKQQPQQSQQQQRSSSSAAAVVGLHFLGGSGDSGGGAAWPRLLTVLDDGRVEVRAPPAAAGAEAAAAAAAAGAGEQQAPQQGQAWARAAAFQAAPSVACSALSGDGAALAAGGEGCQLGLWDVAAGARAWQAKGAKPSAVGLVDLPHVTAAAFYEGAYEAPARAPGSGGGDTPGAGALGRRVVVAGTAGHKLLLYDTAAGRRPQLELAWRDARVTALAADPARRRVWAANGAGAVEALDLRAMRVSGGTLKGAAGSVRCLALHPGCLVGGGGNGGDTAPPPALVASAGLDRFVRFHGAESRAHLGRAYLKQALTGVAWLPPAPAAAAGGAAADGAGGDSAAQKQQQQQQRKQPQSKQQRQQQARKDDSEDEEDESDEDVDSSDEEDPSEEEATSSDGDDDDDDDGSSSSDSDEDEGGRRPPRVQLGGGRGSGGKRHGKGRSKGGRGKRHKH